MATPKRDRVNRCYQGTVHLSIVNSVSVGDEVQLHNIVEHDIDCGVRDANDMYDPHVGNAIGDAVFDAGTHEYHAEYECDAGVGAGGTFYILAEDGGRLENPDGFFWVLDSAPA